MTDLITHDIDVRTKKHSKTLDNIEQQANDTVRKLDEILNMLRGQSEQISDINVELAVLSTDKQINDSK